MGWGFLDSIDAEGGEVSIPAWGFLSHSTTSRPAVENKGNDQFYSSQLSLTVPTAHWALSTLAS